MVILPEWRLALEKFRYAKTPALESIWLVPERLDVGELLFLARLTDCLIIVQRAYNVFHRLYSLLLRQPDNQQAWDSRNRYL